MTLLVALFGVLITALGFPGFLWQNFLIHFIEVSS